jgi:NTP pyrophosphatase (non-canonical NTP hydrolase)
MTQQFDYVAEATKTLSNQFHNDKVHFNAYMSRMLAAILALQHMDEIKKSLFYGREFKIPPPDKMTNEHDFRMALSYLHDDPIKAEHILHGVIGLATEAGELLEAVFKAMNKGQQLDLVNMKEEVGDGKWYMAVLANACGFTWGDDEQANIAKLRKRFPNAFTEHDANTRDLDAERKVLEDSDKPTTRKYFKGE